MKPSTPAPNADAYRAAWATFWGNVTALEQIVQELSLIHI